MTNPNYEYRKYVELRDGVREKYLESTGKKSISPEVNMGIRMALSYVLENYMVAPYRDKSVFGVRPAERDDPMYVDVIQADDV